MQHKRLQGLCTKIVSEWYSQSEGNDMLNRCDFRCVLKVENVRGRHRSTGRLFQARGPATARARSPTVERRVAGTRTSAVDAERSRRRESTSDSGWINSDRYWYWYRYCVLLNWCTVINCIHPFSCLAASVKQTLVLVTEIEIFFSTARLYRLFLLTLVSKYL